MAKAAQVEIPPASEVVQAPPVPKAGRHKLILIGAAVVILLGAAAGAAWHFAQSDEAEPPVAKGKSAVKGKDKEKEAEKARKSSVFMTLETFTVNLQEEGGEHFLQTSIVFEVADEKTADLIKAQMPVIRSKMLLLLSSKRPSEIKTPEGKEKLAAEIVTEARKNVNVKSPELALVNVLFNAFVIQ